jgi:hypothetical protein
MKEDKAEDWGSALVLEMFWKLAAAVGQIPFQQISLF